MKNVETTQKARALFDKGSDLFRQGLYEQSLAALDQAEVLFRQVDVRGNPFIVPLENGVSGLANTLALAGRCHQQRGDLRAAVRCYETSFLNANFEKRRPFQKFTAEVNKDLIACYTQLRGSIPRERLDTLRSGDPDINTDALFPYSLEPDAIILARLFELDPKMHDNYREAYFRAKARDSEARTREKKTDATMMRRFSFTIWGILIIIWALYGLFVVNTLLKDK